MDDWLYRQCREQGCVLRREALALGYHDRAIAALVRSGDWVRLRHGAYVVRPLWDAANPMERHAMRSRAAYRTAATDVVLSHTSSLSVHETPYWDLDLDLVHLTRLDHRTGRREAGLSQHRGRVLPEDILYDGELAYMSGTRTALEMTTITDVERALVVVNGLLHTGHTSKQQLMNRYVDMEMWPHTLTTDLVLRLCDSRIESVLESRGSHVFFRQGLPQPQPQFELRDHTGSVVARLDFAWPEHGVYAEADGRVKYEDPRGRTTAIDVLMKEKEREALISELTGWICVRFTWADLSHPERLAARVRSAFARARSAAI